jgi:hypothetical protein
MLLVYGALSYYCIGPYATSVWGLKVLVYGALSYTRSSVETTARPFCVSITIHKYFFNLVVDV